MALTAKTNVTYVSFLINCYDSPIDPATRLGWLQPLLALDIPLILFVDSYYEGILPPVGQRTKVVPLQFQELRTVQRITAVSDLKLPPHRNSTKDTLEFMALMNSKPELLSLAANWIETPYAAYIDSGISKICSSTETLARLETLQVSGTPLVMLPGCHRPTVVEAFPRLWQSICWQYCGGFFIVPTSRIEEFDEAHTAALDAYLNMGAITWEVNVWASFLPSRRDSVWYKADHNDTMISAVPSSAL
jgi:hypothetical protein